MYDQMHPYFNPIFSKPQCGFSQEHCSQKSLLAMTEKWRAYTYNGQIVGVIYSLIYLKPSIV